MLAASNQPPNHRPGNRASGIGFQPVARTYLPSSHHLIISSPPAPSDQQIAQRPNHYRTADAVNEGRGNEVHGGSESPEKAFVTRRGTSLYRASGTRAEFRSSLLHRLTAWATPRVFVSLSEDGTRLEFVGKRCGVKDKARKMLSSERSGFYLGSGIRQNFDRSICCCMIESLRGFRYGKAAASATSFNRVGNAPRLRLTAWATPRVFVTELADRFRHLRHVNCDHDSSEKLDHLLRSTFVAVGGSTGCLKSSQCLKSSHRSHES